MEVKSFLNEYLSSMIALRRELHQIPEETGKEFKTQQYIADKLDALNIKYAKINTGLYCDFAGVDNTKTIALRADIDALPMVEQSGAEFASTNGCMHSCGHDGHTALLLTICEILTKQKPKFNIRAIFQYGEEGEGGADVMINHGVLDGVDEIFALHVDPALPIGRIATKKGALFAGTVEFNVSFVGKSSHCASPKDGIDALESLFIFANNKSYFIHGYEDNCLLHIGKIEGGDARNIVADSAKAYCTLRYFDVEQKNDIMSKMESFLIELDARFKTKHELFIKAIFPPLINSAKSVDYARSVAQIDECNARYTAEDFAFYTQKIDGCMVWLGIMDEQNNHPLHSNQFNFDENALLYGLEYFTRLIF